MNNIKRYDPAMIDSVFSVVMDTCEDGEYVTFEDYEKRIAELESQVEFEMNEKAKARKQRGVCAKRNTKLDEALKLIVKMASHHEFDQAILNIANEALKGLTANGDKDDE